MLARRLGGALRWRFCLTHSESSAKQPRFQFFRPRSLVHAAAAADDEQLQHFVKHEVRYPLFVPSPDPDVEGSAAEIWRAVEDKVSRDLLDEYSKSVTRDVVNNVVIKMCSRQKYLAAFLVSQWVIKSQPYQVTTQDMDLFLYFASVLRKSDKAMWLFETLKEKTAFAYEAALKMRANSDELDAAEELFRSMKEAGLVTGPGPYSHLLSMYLRSGFLDKATGVLAEMKTLCIEADSDIYKVLLDHREMLDEDELEENVEQFLNKVKDTKLRGTEWKNVMILQASLKRSSEVERLWKEMQDEGFVPDRYYYTTMTAFAMLGDTDRMEELSETLEFQSGSLLPDHIVTLIIGYCMNGLMDRAEANHQRLQNKKSAMAYHHLVAGYMKAGNPGKALEKLQEGLGYAPMSRLPVDTFLLAMKAHAQTGNTRAAEKLLKRALRRESRVRDLRLFNGLLKVYAASPKPVAPNWKERMAKANIVPNDETWQLIWEIEARVRAREEV